MSFDAMIFEYISIIAWSKLSIFQCSKNYGSLKRVNKYRLTKKTPSESFDMFESLHGQNDSKM